MSSGGMIRHGRAKLTEFAETCLRDQGISKESVGKA